MGVAMGNDTKKPDAAFFKKALADRDMSQRALARLMQLDVASLNRMFSGDRAVQTHEAVKIARFLNLDLMLVIKKFGIETHGVSLGNGTNGS